MVRLTAPFTTWIYLHVCGRCLSVQKSSPRFLSGARWYWVQDPVQRRAVKRLLLISHAYAVIWFVVGFVDQHWLLRRQVVWLLVIYGVIGQSIFYILLRGGYTLHLKDPLFCFPQALFGVGAVVIGYALIPYGQGASLQVLFVLLVYDLHRLSPRQIGIVSGAAVVALSLLVGGSGCSVPRALICSQESLNIGMAVMVILMLSAVSGAVRRVHIHQLEQKAELDKSAVRIADLVRT
jgi:hypothetical protein